MEAWGHYWDLFLNAQREDVLSFWNALLHVSWTDKWLAPFLVFPILFALEAAFPWRRQQRWLRPGLPVDLLYTLINSLLLWALVGNAVVEVSVLAFHDALHSFFGITNLVAIRLDGIQMWARFLLMLVFMDFVAWVGHWLLHRVGFLWQFHKVHHSSRELDIWNAQRFHFGEQMFWPFFKYVPIALVGFPTGEVFVGSLVMSLFSTYTHANVKIPMGPLRFIINNPQLHIWHHAMAINPQRNVNYADALAIWDYLFGTAYRPADREGLPLGFDDIESYPTDFARQQVEPFRGLWAQWRETLAASLLRRRST